MNKELKIAIVNFMFENDKVFQLTNTTTKQFRQYIYTPDGEYCFGGENVSEFIDMTYGLINF